MRSYLRRGAIAGVIGGLLYGLFVAVVGRPMVAVAELYEHESTEQAAHGGEHLIGSDIIGAVASIAGGVLFGILLGVVVFGIAYYLLEPAIPGPEWANSYVLAAAGFVTISGAPWLVLPPQPPGLKPALGTDARIALYVGMMIAGAVACLLAGVMYRRSRPAGRGPALVGAALPIFVLVGLAVILAPPAPTGEIPEAVIAAFQAIVVSGQIGLWVVLAAVYNHLESSADRRVPTATTAG